MSDLFYRPKYMIDKMMHFPKYQSRPNGRDIIGLLFVVVDDVGTAYQSFVLTETAKDTNPHATLKVRHRISQSMLFLQGVKGLNSEGWEEFKKQEKILKVQCISEFLLYQN